MLLSFPVRPKNNRIVIVLLKSDVTQKDFDDLLFPASFVQLQLESGIRRILVNNNSCRAVRVASFVFRFIGSVRQNYNMEGSGSATIK